jgi:predicted nuclease of predicted toxin-antitoxin system
MALALKEARVLVTLDKDFGELAVLQGARHGGILRLVDFSVRQQAAASLRILTDYRADLEEGCFITAQPGRIRIRQSRK